MACFLTVKNTGDFRCENPEGTLINANIKVATNSSPIFPLTAKDKDFCSEQEFLGSETKV